VICPRCQKRPAGEQQAFLYQGFLKKRVCRECFLQVEARNVLMEAILPVERLDEGMKRCGVTCE